MQLKLIGNKQQQHVQKQLTCWTLYI